MRANRASNVVCEQQAKFVQERIVSVEKHFSEMCTIFGSLARKSAGLRDKNDELSKAVKSYADNENVNHTLKAALCEFSAVLGSVGDYRDTQVKRVESKVVNELSQYDGICKHSREEVKATFSAREKELVRKRQLDRIRERNPRNRQMITLAETELLKASADVSRTMKGLEEQMNIFEKKKLEDIKSILQDYALTELSFHAKAIELFTKAFQDLQNISVEDDLEEFRDVLRVPDSISRLDTVKRTSFRSSTPLGSLANLFTTPPRFRRSSDSGLARSPQKERNAKSQSMDSLKKTFNESSESVEVEDFINEVSSYSSDDGYNRK